MYKNLFGLWSIVSVLDGHSSRPNLEHEGSDGATDYAKLQCLVNALTRPVKTSLVLDD